MRTDRARRALRIAAVLALAAALAPGCSRLRKQAYEAGRDDWQQPDAVVEALALEPGDTVADLGAGSGYFTARLARAVGPEGRVYAVDVDPDILELLAARMAEEGVTNVETVVGAFDDPKLPDGEIDLVFTSNTYHHLEDRTAYFERLRADLAPGGRVAVIEFDGRKGWFVRWMGHYTPRDVVVGEMTDAGYRVVAEPDFLDRQVFAIFAVEGDDADR